MMKILKWGLIVVGSLIVLLILAILIIPQFVDVEKYKPQIEKKVAEATGRPVKLGGDINLSLFPWVGVALSDLQMGNPPGFDKEDFLSVESFEARVKVLPLIKRDIQVQRFVLEKPRIVLIRNEEGRGNWEGLGRPSPEKPAEGPEEGPSEEEPTEGLPLKSLVVGEFSISNGSLLWINRLTGQRNEVSNVNLDLRNVSLENPVELDFSALLDGKPLALQGNVGPVGMEPGKGKIPLDLSFEALEQVDLSMKGHVTDPAVSPSFDLQLEMAPFSPKALMADLGRPFPVETASDALQKVAFAAHIKGTPQSMTVSNGTLDLDDSHMTFSVEARDLSKPDVTFEMQLDTINIDRYLQAAKVQKTGKVEAPKIQQAAATTATKKQGAGPSDPATEIDYGPLRKAVVDGSVAIGEATFRGATIREIEVAVSGEGGVFEIDPFSLQLNDGALVTNATLDMRKDEPHYTADVQLSAFSPRKLVSDLGEDFPIDTSDPQALNQVACRAKISGTPRRVAITDGVLDLDDSQLQFTFKARDLDKPDVMFDVHLDEIDLDRYLPPPSEKQAAAKTAGKDKTKQDETAAQPSRPAKRDYSTLRQAVLEGRVRIGKLKVRNTRAGDIDLKVSGKNGVFKVDPLSLKAYEGSITSASVLNVQGQSPKSKVDLKIADLQVGPFLREAMDKDLLEGTMHGDFALNMQGDEPERIKRTLNGEGNLLFKDGAIKGIDLAGMVRNAKATFGLAERPAERPKTDFSELRVPFTMANGVFNTSEAALLSPLLRVKAAGNADLVAETLDFRVEPKFVGTIKGQGDTVERAGIMVPVLVQGTFSEPTFRPDLAGMIRSGVGERLPKEIPQELKKPSLENLVPGKEGEPPDKQIEEKAKDLLKSLPFQKD